MEDSSRIFSIIAGIIGIPIGGSSTYFSAAESTHTNAADTSANSSASISEGSGDASGAMGGGSAGSARAAIITATGCGIAGSVTTSTKDDGQDNIIIAIFKRKDSMPYNRVEQRADSIYNSLHGKKEKTRKHCFLMTDSEKCIEPLHSLLSGQSVEALHDQLETVQAVLKGNSD